MKPNGLERNSMRTSEHIEEAFIREVSPTNPLWIELSNTRLAGGQEFNTADLVRCQRILEDNNIQCEVKFQSNTFSPLLVFFDGVMLENELCGISNGSFMLRALEDFVTYFEVVCYFGLSANAYVLKPDLGYSKIIRGSR